MNSHERRAVFLDRDGVLIEDRESYVRSWSDVSIFPEAVEGCHRLAAAGFFLVVVTNQAVVGRGLLTIETVREINQRILDVYYDRGAPIHGAYICPHHPDDGCECRKPKPGMLRAAAMEHKLNLASSFLIGDAVRDLEAARAAGVNGVLVRTGKGAAEELRLGRAGLTPWGIFDDLGKAADGILKSLCEQ
jgi:D-glycero-D-manno-heptose 1,7-bisphosphate phosphatase